MVRVSLESAQFWSLPDHHRFAPLCGVVITTSLSGRLIRIPSAVPVGVREVWPTRTVRFPLPGSMTTGSAQPSTHLPHKIGRASCRESGDGTAVDLSLKMT